MLKLSLRVESDKVNGNFDVLLSFRKRKQRKRKQSRRTVIHNSRYTYCKKLPNYLAVMMVKWLPESALVWEVLGPIPAPFKLFSRWLAAFKIRLVSKHSELEWMIRNNTFICAAGICLVSKVLHSVKYYRILK